MTQPNGRENATVSNVTECAVLEVVMPVMTAAIRGTLWNISGGKSAIPDVVQDSACALLQVIRSGDLTPWEVGLKRYARGLARKQALLHLRRTKAKRAFSLNDAGSLVAKSGIPMEAVIDCVVEAVQDERGRKMVVEYIENYPLSTAECGRRAGVMSRTTACRLWNEALENLRDWLESNSLE